MGLNTYGLEWPVLHLYCIFFSFILVLSFSPFLYYFNSTLSSHNKQPFPHLALIGFILQMLLMAVKRGEERKEGEGGKEVPLPIPFAVEAVFTQRGERKH